MSKRCRPPSIAPGHEQHDTVQWIKSSSVPVPYDGLMYFDDGSNTLSGEEGLRLYANGGWEDVASQVQATFTPVIEDSSGNQATTDRERGWYHRSGNIVTVGFSCRVTSTAGMTGANTARFVLPFTFTCVNTDTGSSTSARATSVLGYVTNTSIPACDVVTIRVDHASDYAIAIRTTYTGTGAGMTVAQFGTSEVNFTIVYTI